MLSVDDLRSSLEIARTNWKYWRNVYEHMGTPSTNPLLADPGTLFARFCKEYSVHRTIRSGTQNEFRRSLMEKISSFIEDDSGQALDAIEKELRRKYGTHDPPRKMLSVFSKVSAFIRPERFVAWDQYARKGINASLGRSPNAVFKSYAEYLFTFDTVWGGSLGERVRTYIARHGNGTNERELRFQRRVLDVALMKCGNRKMSETW